MKETGRKRSTMKNHSLIGLLFILIAFGFLSGCNDDENVQVEEPPADLGPWNMIFEENFDSDLSAWDVWFGGAFNEEIQLYRPEQLSLENGFFQIDIQREDNFGPTNIFDQTVKRFEYVSGRIESKATYGPSDEDGEREYRFMASIKLPAGHGMWPAFWTNGDPWPTQGEIDILEARGGEPLQYISNLFYGPVAGVNINFNSDIEYVIGQDLTATFHTYEMIWRAETIDILFDGELMHTYTTNTSNNIANMLGKKQKIVLNTAVGGLFFTDRNSANYTDASRMEVDWVRVYKR